MPISIDQNMPNRVPRKLGAQLVIVISLLTVCILPCLFILTQPHHSAWLSALWCVLIGSLVGPIRIFVAQAGYQIGYDDERLYQRNWGWRWRTMRRFPVRSMSYDEIASIHGRFIDRGSFKKSLFPFDYIELRSHNHETADIEIYPIYLQHPQDKDLLAAIYARCPELFPHDVLAYMNGSREI